MTPRGSREKKDAKGLGEGRAGAGVSILKHQHVGVLPKVHAAVFRLTELVSLFRVEYCQYRREESSGTSRDEPHGS